MKRWAKDRRADKRADDRRRDSFEHHQRRGWVARQSDDRLAIVGAEERWFARLDPQSMNDDARIGDLGDGARQTIAFSDRGSAGYDDRVALGERACQGRFELVRFVAQRRILPWQGAHRAQGRRDRMTIRVADLTPARGNGGIDEFVAAREYRDNGPAIDRNRGDAERREHADLGRANSRCAARTVSPRRMSAPRCATFSPRRNGVSTTSVRSRDARVFDRHDRIGTLRQARRR